MFELPKKFCLCLWVVLILMSKIETMDYSSNLKQIFTCDNNPRDRALPPDPKCTKKMPARCPDIPGIKGNTECKANYLDCHTSPGCNNPKMNVRCITGECVPHIALCSKSKNLKNFQKGFYSVKCRDRNQERCDDGICRWKGVCHC